MALFKVSTYEGRVNPSSRRLVAEASDRSGVAVIRRASADGSKASTGTIIKRGGVAGPASTPGGGLAAPGGLRTPSTIRNQTGNPLLDNSLVDYWIPIDPVGLHQLWRRIYLRDPICGPAIDFFRELPWSEWTLSGVDDKLLQRYDDTLHRINLLGWLPEFSGDFLVLGKGCLHLLWDRTKGEWKDLIIHDPDHIEVSIVPLVNQPIKVDLKPTPAHQAFILSPDPRDQMARKEMDPNIIRMIMCLAGGTLIPTREHGLVPIGELAEICNVPRGAVHEPRDLQLTVATTKQRQGRTAQWYHHGRQETLKITTQMGYRNVATPTHPFLVLSPTSLELEWRKASELRIGDQLCVDLTPCVRTTKLALQLPEPPANKHATTRQQLTAPKYMTPELAFALGVIVAEGCHDPDRVRIANSDRKLLDRYEACLQRVFGLTATREQRCVAGSTCQISGVTAQRTKAGYESSVNSRVLASWLTYLGVHSGSKHGKTSSWYKEVPWSILQADEQSQLAYLAAYVEGDGSIVQHGKALRFYSRSRRNLRQLQVLLAAHGVLSQLSSKYGRLDVGAADMALRLYRKIEPYLVSKRLTEVVHDTTRPTARYGVPTMGLKQLLTKRKRRVMAGRSGGAEFVTDAGERIFIAGWASTCKVDGWLSYDKHRQGQYADLLDGVQQISPTTHVKLVRLLASGYYFDPVTAIKQAGQREVFDLSMAAGEEPAFVANGVMVHNSGEPIPLDPRNTLYLPRRAFPYDVEGVSLFSRVIYFVALERPLFTASILAARRRAGPVTHIAAGNEEWEPTNEELDALALAYMESEEDAVSAVFATRNDVQVNRAVSSLQADLWKINDESQFISEGKMRALGINDAFLAGDASINTTEAATSVFLERIRAHRRLMTERVIQDKIFKEMARANRWIKRTPAEIAHHVREDSDEKAAQDDKRLAIPVVNWTKSLKPTADEQLINLMRQAQEWGLPITIRDLASATGIDIDGVLSDQTEEAELRTKIKTWQDTMQKTGITIGAMSPGGGGEGGGGMMPPGGGEMPGMPPEVPPAGGEAPAGGGEGEAPEGLATAASFGGDIEDAVQQRVAALPIWNDAGRCINVHRDQLRELLHRAEVQQKLARGISWRALQKYLREGHTFTERETEVIGYTLHRVGLLPDFVVPPGFARAVMQSSGRELDNNGGLFRELQYMERFSTVRRRLDAAGANARLKRELAIPGRRLYTGV